MEIQNNDPLALVEEAERIIDDMNLEPQPMAFDVFVGYLARLQVLQARIEAMEGNLRNNDQVQIDILNEADQARQENSCCQKVIKAVLNAFTWF